jgi:hypothetical protein
MFQNKTLLRGGTGLVRLCHLYFDGFVIVYQYG